MKLKISVFFALTAFALSCAKKPAEQVNSTSYLYVASGLCYSGGGNTTYTPATASNIIYKVDLNSGAPGEIIADYSTGTVGDTPTSIIDFDDSSILVLIDNATNMAYRRIEKISRTTDSSRPTYVSNGTIFPATATHILRELVKNPDGTLQISRSVAVEKLNTSKNRVSAPWINGASLTGSCSTSATLISSIQTTASGKTIYTHANTSQNKIGVVGSNGYSTVSDCLNSVSAPVATAFPTASIYIDKYNMLLVAFGGTAAAADNNSIYAYDFNDSTGVLSGSTKAFQDNNVLYGISAMTYDENSGFLYVATSNSTTTVSTGYNIEKFTFDPTTKALSRVGVTPFSTHWVGSKCISSMFVGN